MNRGIDVNAEPTQEIQVVLEQVGYEGVEVYVDDNPIMLQLSEPAEVCVAVNETVIVENPNINQVQSDYAESDNTKVSYIKNKPQLSTVAISGSYVDLTHTPTVPNYPLVPTLINFLRDDNTFSPIAVGGGGNTSTYMSNADSDVSPYKKLSNVLDSSEVQKTITSNSNTKVYGETYLFDLPADTTVIPSGSWTFDYWRMVDSAAGTSVFGVEVFARTTGGVETTLFTLTSPAVTDLTFTERFVTYNLPQFTINYTDRLGVRTFFQASRTPNTTITYIIGDGRGWSMRTPLPFRHGDLRDLNGDTNIQHLTNSERFLGGLATGVSNPAPLSSQDLSTINKVANILDANIPKVTVDLVSTTKAVTILNNDDIRYGTLSSLSISGFPASNFIASIAFSSGATATSFSFTGTVKWQGVDCGTGTFIPKSSKRYNVVFWYDSVNINGVVNGV